MSATIYQTFGREITHDQPPSRNPDCLAIGDAFRAAVEFKSPCVGKGGTEGMVILKAVDVSDVQAHEAATHANVKLGGYHMDQCCPLSEFKAFNVRLEASDIDRLFLLNCGFAAYTEGQTCRLRDVLPGVESHERVRNVIDKACFPVSPDQAILIVSANENCGPLMIYDGNHRAMAQYLKQRTVQDVLAYVCVHRRISEWGFVPPLARGYFL